MHLGLTTRCLIFVKIVIKMKEIKKYTVRNKWQNRTSWNTVWSYLPAANFVMGGSLTDMAFWSPLRLTLFLFISPEVGGEGNIAMNILNEHVHKRKFIHCHISVKFKIFPIKSRAK